MLIEETLFGTVDKVKDSIERLKAFEPKDKPYWLAFSGGKDSVVILELAKMAGVKFEAHYNVTSADPPELVRFIKTQYPEVSFDIPHGKDGKPITMWTLIPKKALPPTRIQRYCCSALKESSGKGFVTITGVRWAESNNRKANQGMVTIFGGKSKDIGADDTKIQTQRGGIVMNDDNDETRRAIEICYRTHKTLVNPIIDWEDEDVWEFIHKYNVPYCELYDQGEKRLGCIGCPMSGSKQMLNDFERYHKYKNMYIHAFDRMLKTKRERGKEYKNKFENGGDVFEWWTQYVGKQLPTQSGLFDDEYEDGDET